MGGPVVGADHVAGAVGIVAALPLGAMAIHIGGHAGRGDGQLLPGQPRQHPLVSAQGIAVKAGGASCLALAEAAGLGFLDAAGQVYGPTAGAVRQLQQGSVVVDQLKTAPQAAGVGCSSQGAQPMLGAVSWVWRWGYWGWAWLLVGSEPLPEALIDCSKSHAGSAWFQPGIRANESVTPRGSVSYAGPHMDQACWPICA